MHLVYTITQSTEHRGRGRLGPPPPPAAKLETSS